MCIYLQVGARSLNREESAMSAAAASGAAVPEEEDPESPASQMQDYTRVAHYLTETVWHDLLQKQEVLGVKAESLFRHCYALGLRNPTEPTTAVMTALLVHAEGEMTSFELHTKFKQVKGMYKAMVRKRRLTDPWRPEERPGRLERLATLPQVAERAFSLEAPVPSKIGEVTLYNLIQRIPMRSSHSFVDKGMQDCPAGAASGPWAIAQKSLDLLAVAFAAKAPETGIKIYPCTPRMGLSSPGNKNNQRDLPALEDAPHGDDRAGGQEAKPHKEERPVQKGICRVTFRLG